MINIQEVIDTLLDTDYSYFGVRAIDEVLNVGDACAASRVWDNDQITDRVLDGASATEIRPDDYSDEELTRAFEKAMNINKSYCGAHRYIIASDHAQYGEDLGEVVLEDAVVIAVIH